MRMNLATNASRWKITFCRSRRISIELRGRNTQDCTYTTQLDSVLVESRPFDHVGFQGIVDFRDKLEGQDLQPLWSIKCDYIRTRDSHTLRMVVGGIQ